MLYGTPTHNDGGDRDYEPGLGTTSPQRRPGIRTVGGGYSPQGGGGGGAPTGGEVNVSGSRVRSGYAPADRSTSVRSIAAKENQKARLSFQKSGRGSKASPLSPNDGLSGLGFGFGNLLPPRSIRRRFSRKSRAEQAAPVAYLATPAAGIGPLNRLPYGILSADEKLSGLDGFSLKRAFKPPKAVQAVINKVVAPEVKKVIRYAGVATATVVSGGFIPQPVMRQAFGLSAKESKMSETALKVARGVTTAVAVVATAGALGYGPAVGAFQAPVGAAGAAPAGAPLGFSGTASYLPGGASTFGAPTGYAAPAAFGGTGTAVAPGAYTAAGSSSLLSLPSASYTPTGLTFGGTSNLVASAPTIGGVAPGASAGGPSLFGSLARGAGTMAKDIGLAVGGQVILDRLRRQPNEPPASAPEYAPDALPATGYSVAVPSMASQLTGGGQPSGGESYPGEQVLASMGVSPVVAIGLGLAGLAMILGKTKLTRRIS